MRPRWLLLLAALAGCGKACEEKTPVAVLPAADAGAKVAVAPKTARDFAHKYVVIVATEKDEQKFEEAKTRLAAIAPVALSSTAFSGLKPCFSLLVASAHATKDDALAAAKALKAKGVDGYIRNTRDFVGDHPARQELCAVPEKQVASDVWLVAGRGLLLGPSSFDVKLETEDRRTWRGPIRETEVNGIKKGDAFRVVAMDGSFDETCKVKGFEALVRGDPHFGYFQQDPPPTTPGCGSQEDFAVLDCELPDAPLVALRAETLKDKKVERYVEGETPKGIDLKKLEHEIEDSRDYQSTRADFNNGGAPGAEVTETWTHQFFEGKSGTVVYSQLDISKPLELTECGQDEMKARFSRAILVQPTNHLELLPAARRDDTEPVGFADVDLDGEVEVLMDEKSFTTTRELHRGGMPIATDSVQFCDCPC